MNWIPPEFPTCDLPNTSELPQERKQRAAGGGGSGSSIPLAPEPQNSTQVNTFITPATGKAVQVLQAMDWTRVKLMLTTAGPVTFGTSSDGRGAALVQNVMVEFDLARGDFLYITAQSTNSVTVIVQQIPVSPVYLVRK